MLTADERIVLIRIKIERAKKHIKELAADILATEYRNVLLADIDPHSSERFVKLAIPGRVARVPRFSADVLAGVGDIAHNLRTALDHLMCHLLLVARSRITTRDTFPISEDVHRYETRKAGLIHRIRQEAIEAIDLLKPYKGGNDDLWRIHELDRIDKHRALFTFAHDFVFHADWCPDFLLKKDAPDFARLYDQQVEQNLQFEIEETLSQAQVAGSDAILPSLHQLADITEGIVLGFKPWLE